MSLYFTEEMKKIKKGFKERCGTSSDGNKPVSETEKAVRESAEAVS